MAKMPNKQYTKHIKDNYNEWKKSSLANTGYFVIFKGFKDTNKLKNISGNALKLYVYLGLNSNNITGEVWHSNARIAKYFQRTERTIRLWMQELESLNLIIRLQLNFNEESHTFLQPYSNYNSPLNGERYTYTYRLKSIEAREEVDLRLFNEQLKESIQRSIKEPKIYVKVNEKDFRIISYSPIEKKYLRNMSKYILKSIPLFDEFVCQFKYLNKKGEIKYKRQLFERIKIKR